MKQVLFEIERRKQILQETEFCYWLKNQNTATPSLEDPFEFTPAMLFFVLGFKDILTHMKIEKPQSVWEHMINQHCEEDSNHWLWYLRDLERLGFEQKSWGDTTSDIFKTLWSDKNQATRDMVYLSIHHIRKNENPLIKLAIIESLEAAFGVFIDCMNQPTQAHRVYDQLEYFGKLHNDKEHSHSLGHWIDGHQENTELSEEKLDVEARHQALATVTILFNQFEKIFQTWFEQRSAYPRLKENLDSSFKFNLKDTSMIEVR